MISKSRSSSNSSRVLCNLLLLLLSLQSAGEIPGIGAWISSKKGNNRRGNSRQGRVSMSANKLQYKLQQGCFGDQSLPGITWASWVSAIKAWHCKPMRVQRLQLKDRDHGP